MFHVKHLVEFFFVGENFTDEKYLSRKENENDCRDSYVQNEGSFGL
jgi:hypothetical protein